MIGRVLAQAFFTLHVVWIGQLQIALNGGLLPKNFYAMAEQDAGDIEPEVLTLQRQAGRAAPESANHGEVLTVADAPPTSRRFEACLNLTKPKFV